MDSCFRGFTSFGDAVNDGEKLGSDSVRAVPRAI